MNEDLIPEGLRNIYRTVYTSADDVEDERVKIALFAVLGAIDEDIAAAQREAGEPSNVVQFPRPEDDQVVPELAKSR